MSLGTNKRGRAIALTDEERSRHVHVVGASGTGKSKLLESLIRQDILRERGLCLIDPHGTLADDITAWCAALNLAERRRIHILDLKSDEWSAGFNPLRVSPDIDVEARVDAMVATCAEVWGGEDLNQTPLLTTCLQLLFYALAQHDLTLAEALELSASNDSGGIRRRLTARLANPVYASYWREFSTLSRKDFEERFSSARRRLLRFLASPTVRRIVGQRERALDLRQIMDNDEILIVNLVPRGGVSQDNGRLLGALLLSEFRLCALSRNKETARRHPFSLYVDECYDYLTGDVERMLDETRKFGLHTVLAHQRLGQLRDRSETLFNGVMAGGQTKIVFGGMTDDDAEIMAREVYRSSFNLERPKHSLDKPVVVDEIPYWLESENSSSGSSTTEGTVETSGWSTGSTEANGINERLDVEGLEVLGQGRSSSSSTSSGESGSSGSSYSHTLSSGKMWGRSQTLKPLRVIMPTAVHSLDEELHLAIVKLRELPNQAAILKRRNRQPIRFRPATIKPAVSFPQLTASFVERSHELSPYVTLAAEAEQEIAERLGGMDTEEQPSSRDAPFWEEMPDNG